MWRMLQQDVPDDYVIGKRFLRDGVQLCRPQVSAICHGRPELYRPAEVDVVVGMPAKAKQVLGWHAEITLEKLVLEMVDTDCREAGVEIAREAHI